MIQHARDEDVRGALMEMLKTSDRPSAVFCNDAAEAEQVFLDAIRLGLRVPHDLSIIGFGCTRRDGVLSQRLAAVTIDEADLGRQAALLIGQMQAGQEPSGDEENIVMPLSFSEGQSLGSVPEESLLNSR